MKKCIKKNKKFILNKDNHNIFFFLLGCSSLFFSCQILKTSYLIKNDSEKYNHCTNVLDKYLTDDSTIKVCEILNNRENFQNFLYNFLYTILIMYALIREVIKKYYFDIKYWGLAHLSLIGFTLTGNYKVLQFSINTRDKYSTTQFNIIIIGSFLIGFLILRQIYYCKINYYLIINFLSIYLMMYLLLLSMTNNIVIHLHHALICGLLSLCFTDFKSNFEKYIHSIMIGITVQGFNTYSLSEVWMFYISDISPPSVTYLSITYGVFVFFWFVLILIRNKKCLGNNDNNSGNDNSGIDNSGIDNLDSNNLGIDIQMPLIPTPKDIYLYQKNT